MTLQNVCPRTAPEYGEMNPVIAPRETWIDALKGWGMLLIVVGHVWSLSDVSTAYMWIFSFHVPLFFFASGLTLKPGSQPLDTFLRNRARSILVPYFIYALLGYLFYVLGFAAATLAGKQVAQFSYGLWWPLLGAFYGTVGDGLLVNSPLWFLPALFLASGLVYALNQRLQSALLRYAVLAAVFGVGAWVGERLKLPMSAVSALCAAVFMQMGLDFRRCGWLEKLRPAQQWGLLPVMVVISLLSPLNGAVGLAGPAVNQPLMFFAFALVGIGLSVLLSRLVWPRSRWLTMLGQHSMGILVLHMLVIKGVKVILSLGTGVSLDTMEHQLGFGLFVLVASALILWPSIWLIERWLPWTLGNRRPAA